MRKICFFILVLIGIVGCKSDAKKTTNPSDGVPEALAMEQEKALSNVSNPVLGNSSLPKLFSNGNSLFMSWVEEKDSLAILKYSELNDAKWTEPTEITSGTDWFVNWADFPAIAENNGRLLTNFLQKSANGTYTYDVKLNLYNPESQTWKNDFILHNDGTQSEHGFVSMRPYAANSFMVTWLDGRETVGSSHGGGQMTLRGALVFDDGSIQYDTLLDERVCDCCQTATAIGPNDVILVAYRDRTEDEIRDISLVRWEMESGWSVPKPIGSDNWKIAGCPVNGPSMDTFENGVAIAWFTAVNDDAKVQIVFSEDTGLNFGRPVRIDAGNATGRVDVAMISENEAAVLWMEPQGENEVIQLTKIASNGKMGQPITISRTSSERASGFPQMERVGEELYVAWTEVSENKKSVRTAKIGIINL